jgi:arabinogalactan oligomer / maltooligosaccharide transport system permease protein
MFPRLLAYLAIFALLLSFQEYFPAIGLGTLPGLILVYLGGARGEHQAHEGLLRHRPARHRRVGQGGRCRACPHLRPPHPAAGHPDHRRRRHALVRRDGNDYLIARTVQGDNPDVQTLPVGLYEFISRQFEQDWGTFAAGAILGAIPPTIIFFFAQRYIASGLLAGSVKG